MAKRKNQKSIDENIPEYLSRQILKQHIETHVISGEITTDDLKDKKKLFQKFRKLKDSTKYNYIVDHRPEIVIEANRYYTNGDYEFGKILYATFFEHTLNSIVEVVCARKQIAPKMRADIIRNNNLIAKVTWLWRLLDLKPIQKKHLDVMIKVAEERNAFVHYKWNNFLGEMTKDKVKEEQLQKEIKRAITYLRRYEAALFYNKNLKNINKALKID